MGLYRLTRVSVAPGPYQGDRGAGPRFEGKISKFAILAIFDPVSRKPDSAIGQSTQKMPPKAKIVRV